MRRIVIPLVLILSSMACNLLAGQEVASRNADTQSAPASPGVGVTPTPFVEPSATLSIHDWTLTARSVAAGQRIELNAPIEILASSGSGREGALCSAYRRADRQSRSAFI